MLKENDPVMWVVFLELSSIVSCLSSTVFRRHSGSLSPQHNSHRLQQDRAVQQEGAVFDVVEVVLEFL